MEQSHYHIHERRLHIHKHAQCYQHGKKRSSLLEIEIYEPSKCEYLNKLGEKTNLHATPVCLNKQNPSLANYGIRFRENLDFMERMQGNKDKVSPLLICACHQVLSYFVTSWSWQVI